MNLVLQHITRFFIPAHSIGHYRSTGKQNNGQTEILWKEIVIDRSGMGEPRCGNGGSHTYTLSVPRLICIIPLTPAWEQMYCCCY